MPKKQKLLNFAYNTTNAKISRSELYIFLFFIKFKKIIMQKNERFWLT